MSKTGNSRSVGAGAERKFRRFLAVLRTAKKTNQFSRASAKNIFLGPLRQNPGFCAARAETERHFKKLSRFGGKTPAVF